MTEYVVLSGGDPDGAWYQLGATYAAKTPKGAIEQAIIQTPELASKYVAVPARSWQPMSAKSETRIKFS